MSQSRQLAAIMFTDIVGYTALMGEDEQKALELLDRNRRTQRPIIEKYQGEWLKEIGDGVLASFKTVSEAVYCAATIQEICKNDPGLNLRIGIHQGEVVFSNNDVFGDGVNIASRLEALAPAGGILVSDTVHRNVINKKGIVSTFVGEEKLKGINEPVKIYQVEVEGMEPVVKAELTDAPLRVSPKPRNNRKMAFATAGVLIVLLLSYFLYSNFNTETLTTEAPVVQLDKSIVVLPFTNLSSDPEQEYFSDGMMEEILNHLVKIEDLKVISRTTAMQYKGTSKSVHEITEELNVATALEGSVRKDGNKIRITVQLIAGDTDTHLWSESYDRELTDIFQVQSDVAQLIAQVLQAEVSPETRLRIESQPTTNIEAYNLFLLAEQMELTDDNHAIDLYEQVIQLDPEFANAYARLGDLKRGRHENPDPVKAVEIGKSYYEKALELDPENYEAHLVKGQSHLWYEWDFKKADQAYQFLKLHYPNSFILPALLLSSGRFKEALDNSKRNIKTDPLDPVTIGYHLLSLYYSGEKEQLLEEIPNALLMVEGIQNQRLFLYNRIAEAYQFLGMYQESLNILENHFDDNSIHSMATQAINYLHLQQPIKTKEILQNIKLMSEESSQSNTSFNIAKIYAQTQEADLAFEWLDKAYQKHEQYMYWLKVNPSFAPLHNDPRWQVILDKVGFPK